jgi:LysM repeat protein
MKRHLVSIVMRLRRPALLAGQIAVAALVLLGTAWWLWPWADRQVPAASFWPTLTPTITRVPASPTRVPTVTPVVPTATPVPVIHIVQPKEVMGIIAKEYGITVEAIMTANGIQDANLVVEGTKLIIPDPQRTPVFTPTQTSTRAATAIPTPTGTPTPPWRDVAPVLLAPTDGEVFQGQDAVIVLRWASTATLGDSEYYEIRLWSAPQGEEYALLYYTQASTWLVPAELHPRSRDGTWYWTVSAVYRARQNIQLSPAASPRRLVWR